MNTLPVKHPGGRPRKWTAPEEVTAMIDPYFDKLEQAGHLIDAQVEGVDE